MADLKTNELPVRRGRFSGPDTDSGQAADHPGGLAEFKSDVRRVLAVLRPGYVWRCHRLFVILLVLSLIPRILAALAYRPALLTADSFLYMQNAVNGKLGYLRPSGYSFFLAIFHGVPHVLLLVTTLQHLMELAVAVVVYALLRYYRLPGWGAALLTVPILFDGRVIALESFILSDTLFCLVIVVATALLLTRRTPRMWQCVAAGLLLAYAALLRGNGIPLVIVVAVFMIVRRVGWKRFAAASLVFVIPVLGYVLAFHGQYGKYNLTTSDGIFLWSRTTSFANCKIIKPPANLRPLCPNLEKSMQRPPTPAWSIDALMNRTMPTDYIWASDVWWRHDAHPGINVYNDKLGEEFAKRAIEAQPLSYLRVASRDLVLTFLTTDRPQGGLFMTLPQGSRIKALPAYYQNDIKAYAGTTSNTRATKPYIFWLELYQQSVIFPGWAYVAVLITGLVGLLRNWRRWGGKQLLPWGLAAVSLVSPALLTQTLYRYTIVAIPLAVLAAGLTWAQFRERRIASATAAAASGTASPAAPSPASTASTSTAPGSTAPTSTAPTSTGPTSTGPTSTGPAETEAASAE
ncbi:MAG TPA: hypothetical protein VGG25_03290 [Streptosporangiaceae bacterium]